MIEVCHIIFMRGIKPKFHTQEESSMFESTISSWSRIDVSKEIDSYFKKIIWPVKYVTMNIIVSGIKFVLCYERLANSNMKTILYDRGKKQMHFFVLLTYYLLSMYCTICA